MLLAMCYLQKAMILQQTTDKAEKSGTPRHLSTLLLHRNRLMFFVTAYAVYIDNDKLAFHKSIFHLSASAFFSSLWVFEHPFTWP